MRFYGSPRIAYARDGSGNYSLAEAAFVDGTTIEAAKVNSNLNDIASALTGSLAKNGETTPTANLPMGSYKHTGVANTTSRTHYAAAGQIADNAIVYAADSGAADAYVITLLPALTAYVVGQRFTFKVANANATTTPTLNVNTIGAGVIKWPNGDALTAGDLPANALVEVVVAATTPVFHLQTVSVTGLRVTAATGTGDFVRAASPTLTGNPIAPTQSAANNSTRIATTAYADRVGVQQIQTFRVTSVGTSTAVVPFDDTIPQNTEGTAFLTKAITPKSATSVLVIEAELCVSASTPAGVIMSLFQDSTADALATTYNYLDTAFGRDTITLRYYMAAGTTSSTTFTIRAGLDAAGTLTVNGSAGARLFGGVMNSSLIITEIGI